ncbi:MAG: hypothetical protein IIY58_04080 [Aeriscardovia sp.]|nr:hypothetical protein [Aeriscardovia sp.]
MRKEVARKEVARRELEKTSQCRSLFLEEAKDMTMIDKYKYVRIQGLELAENTMYPKGIFSMLQNLVKDGVMEEEDKDLFLEIDSWFAEILPFPPQCKRQEKVVCFFKTENSDEMMKMIRPALWLLERYNHPYYLVYTNTPGNIVYEDKYQVVVEVPGVLQIDKLQESWSPEE